jgi:hypothetical protein
MNPAHLDRHIIHVSPRILFYLFDHSNFRFLYRASSSLRVIADRGYTQKWDTKEVFHSVYLETQGKVVETIPLLVYDLPKL